jgi:hypothetical protein
MWDHVGTHMRLRLQEASPVSPSSTPWRPASTRSGIVAEPTATTPGIGLARVHPREGMTTWAWRISGA